MPHFYIHSEVMQQQNYYQLHKRFAETKSSISIIHHQLRSDYRYLFRSHSSHVHDTVNGKFTHESVVIK